MGAAEAAGALARAVGVAFEVADALALGEGLFAEAVLERAAEAVGWALEFAELPVCTMTVGCGGSWSPPSLSSIEPTTTPAVATPATPAMLKPTVQAVTVDAAAAALATEFAASCWLKALGCGSTAFS